MGRVFWSRVAFLLLFVLASCRTDTVVPQGSANPPVINSFTATPSTLPVGGGEVVLSWSVTDATGLWIDQGVGSVKGLTSKSVNVENETNFTIIATNKSGDISEKTFELKRPLQKTPLIRFVNVIENGFVAGRSPYVEKIVSDGKALYSGSLSPKSGSTDYFEIGIGKHEIKVNFDDALTIPAFELMINENIRYTVYFHVQSDEGYGIPHATVVKDISPTRNLNAKIRIINLYKTPSPAQITVYTSQSGCDEGNANTLVEIPTNVKFVYHGTENITSYFDLPPGTYSFTFLPDNRNCSPEIDLKKGAAYSIIAGGIGNDTSSSVGYVPD
jgi:hypothetical protein